MNCMRVLFIAASLATQATWATDQVFVDFALKNAHERGFMKCDAAIKEVFSNVGGKDMRVITQTGLAADSMKMVAVYGVPGDAVYAEAEFRQSGAKCTYTRTSTIVSTKSCTAELGELPAFKYEAETVGVTFTKNAGGVNRILLPVGSQGCATVFLVNGEV
ncbi:hypothetical protein [Ferriphaselus sp. R-1]|uniref:hypothetical protein n=1 Tax=Ferriphaselus sp. R-1 TaxID=1485544 RepID=UPI00054DE63C|nr:hypothetical protein [Ferriphaselus sp. R-1]